MTPDHTEISQFFDEIIHILIKITPMHADVQDHVAKLRTSIDQHKVLGDKYAEALDQLTDTDLEKMVRFVERPGGHHHIAELEKLEKNFGIEAAGRQFLKHFYDHNKNQLIHAEKLQHVARH
jgi:hypothetical protein